MDILSKSTPVVEEDSLHSVCMLSYLCAGILRSPAISTTSHSCLVLRYVSMRLKVCSAWLSAWNNSSGTHGSMEAHEDSVWLLLEVLHQNDRTTQQDYKTVRSKVVATTTTTTTTMILPTTEETD